MRHDYHRVQAIPIVGAFSCTLPLTARSVLHVARLLFVGTLVAAPWMFGGAEAYLLPWIVWPLVASYLCMAVGWAAARERPPLNIPLLAIPVLLGAAWGLVQLAPLFAADGALSAAAQLRSEVALESPAGKLPISLAPAATQRQIAWLTLAAAVLLLAANLFSTAVWRRRLLATLAVNGALLAVVSMLQVATWQGHVYWIGPEVTGRLPAVGPFVYHNQAGAYFAICGACLLGWALAERSSGKRTLPPVQLVVGVCLLGGLLASFSRGALLAALASAMVAAVLAGRGLHVRKIALVAVLLVAGGTGLVWLTNATDHAEDRIASLADQSTYQQDGRIDHWPVALRAARHVWGLGAGLGAYKQINPLFEQRPYARVFERAHNQYLETLVDGGAVAIGLLALALGMAVRLFGRAASSSDSSLAAAGTAALVALAFQVLHGLIDFCLYLPAGLLLMAAIAGLVVLPRRQRGGHQQTKDASAGPTPLRWQGGLLLALLAPAVVLAALVLHQQARIDRAMRLFPWRTVDSEFTRDNADQLVNQLTQAAENCPLDGEAWQAVGEALVLRYRVMARDAIALEFGLAIDNPELWELTNPANLLNRATLFQSQADSAQLAELRADEVIVANLPAASRAYRAANRACPLLPRPVQRLYELSWLGDESAQVAEDALARLVRLAPHDDQRLFEIGSLAYLAGRPGDAIGPWRRALVMRPLLARQITPLASAVLSPEEILTQLLPHDADQLYQIAIFALREPETQALRQLALRKAVDLLQTASENDRKADQWRQLGRLRAALLAPQQACDAYAVAVKKRPTQAEWRQEYAQQLLAAGRLEEAQEQAVAAVRLRPNETRFTRQLKLIRAAIAQSRAQ